MLGFNTGPPAFKSTKEVLQGAASSPILFSWLPSDRRQHRARLLIWRFTNTESGELNLQPNKPLHEWAWSLQFTYVKKKTKETERLEISLHDYNVDSIHGHEDQRLPPAQQTAHFFNYQSQNQNTFWLDIRLWDLRCHISQSRTFEMATFLCISSDRNTTWAPRTSEMSQVFRGRFWPNQLKHKSASLSSR